MSEVLLEPLRRREVDRLLAFGHWPRGGHRGRRLTARYDIIGHPEPSASAVLQGTYMRTHGGLCGQAGDLWIRGRAMERERYGRGERQW